MRFDRTTAPTHEPPADEPTPWREDARGPVWHALTADEAARRLHARPDGLPAAEAAARRAVVGENTIGEARAPSLLSVIASQFSSVLIVILLVATVLTVILGEYLDAAVIAAVLILNAAIGTVQQHRAEASVRALQQLVTPRARVLRDGHEHEVDSIDLVPGDVVLLETGVRVPADLRLRTVTALTVDESLLTGESVPVIKAVDPLEDDAPLGDRVNLAFAGSVVAAGRASGYVIATGMHTELGRIAEDVRSGTTPRTPLQERLDRFARWIGVLVLVVAAAAFVTGTLLGEPPERMFTFAVALAVSAVPEGLPVAFTITLAIGVHRMANRQAIIRRLPAVETLGSTSVICSDKTGTLTENRMVVQELRTADDRFVLDGAGSDRSALGDTGGDRLGTEDLADRPEAYLALLTGVLVSEADAYRADGELHTTGDPTEAALVRAAAAIGLEPWTLRSDHPRRDHLPFEPERRYAAALVELDRGPAVLAQGAPERIVAMCDTELAGGVPRPLSPGRADDAEQLAAQGMRVLAFAYRPVPGSAPDVLHEEPGGMTFLGLQGLADPPRTGVREAVEACHGAGMRVVMVTGDHAGTATEIGRQVGIDTDAGVVTGRDMDVLDDTELPRTAARRSVFARVAPEHKLRIVTALRDQGEVVAVTGDGVNDAPALQAADIGIAMGRGGTDVAREASDMVLADDNFVTIRAAVEQGRIVFDNLRKVTFFLISTGAAEIVMLLTALALRWPLVLLPAQLLWLNLVTNGVQDVALAFEPGEPGVLRRRPRHRAEGLLSRRLWERTALVAVVMATGSLAMFQMALEQTGSLTTARTAAMTTMVLFQAVHVGNCRLEHRSAFASPPWANRVLLFAVVAALALHTAALHLPATQWILRVEPLSLDLWAWGAGIALTVLPAVELHKALRRERPPA